MEWLNWVSLVIATVAIIQSSVSISRTRRATEFAQRFAELEHGINKKMLEITEAQEQEKLRASVQVELEPETRGTTRVIISNHGPAKAKEINIQFSGLESSKVPPDLPVQSLGAGREMKMRIDLGMRDIIAHLPWSVTWKNEDDSDGKDEVLYS